MRDFGSSIVGGRGCRRLVVVVIGLFMKEGWGKENEKLGRCRSEESLAAGSRREGNFEHGRRNMLIYEEGPERAKLNRNRARLWKRKWLRKNEQNQKFKPEL